MQDIKTLNLTHDIREFSSEKLRIKLDVFDPPAISPFPRYDKLKIYAPNAASLFTNFDLRRQLSHDRYTLVLDHSIQKQMYDTSFGHNMIDFTY